MKIRTDLTAFSLTGLCVVAMVVLAALHQPIPELLATITLVSLGVGGGAALPRTAGTSSTPAAAAEPELVGGPGDLPIRAQLPAPGPVGRDWTESIPKITPEMLAEDRTR